MDGLDYKHTDTESWLPYSTSHSKQCSKNNLFVMAGRIGTIVDNNSIKNKHSNELKRNIKPTATLKIELKSEHKNHVTL